MKPSKFNLPSLFLLLVVSSLSGCVSAPPVTENTRPEAVADAERKAEIDGLRRRAELCAQSTAEQRAQLMELTLSDASPWPLLFDRVLLASCSPERTPGLLRQALAAIDASGGTPAQQALLSLLRDHAHSYRLLEAKNHELAAELDATINGIRDIETELNTLRPHRITP